MNNSQENLSDDRPERWAIIGPISSGRTTLAGYLVADCLIEKAFSIESKMVEIMDMLNITGSNNRLHTKLRVKDLRKAISSVHVAAEVMSVARSDETKGLKSFIIEDCMYSDFDVLVAMRFKIIILVPEHKTWVEMVAENYTLEEYDLVLNAANIQRYYQWCAQIAAKKLKNVGIVRLMSRDVEANILLMKNAVTHLRQDDTPVVW